MKNDLLNDKRELASQAKALSKQTVKDKKVLQDSMASAQRDREDKTGDLDTINDNIKKLKEDIEDAKKRLEKAKADAKAKKEGK